MGCMLPMGRNGCVGCVGCALPLVLSVLCLLAPLGLGWMHARQDATSAPSHTSA